MPQKVNLILKEVLEKVKPSQDELKMIKNSLDEFLEKIGKKLRHSRINAEVFVGGSFAKDTVIKKYYYDIDIFIRFDKKYKNEKISGLTKKIIRDFKNVSKIHGSRDYFRIKINPSLFIELIPVIKVRNPKEAKNITDLSYSHVRYIKKNVGKEILNEIRIAKAFCYANNCYGAESYINGFSGYALELLVYYYRSFLKFIRAVSKIKDERLVIDIEKHHKGKNRVLMDLNSSKLQSPIILIDPTYKQRNALAALSKETFEKFKKDCKRFLKNPSIKAFEIKKTDLKKIKEDAEKKKLDFIFLEAKTTRQEGDIAGSKLLKFYRHLSYEIEKFFDIKIKEFEYDEKKSAKYFFAVKNKKEILIRGPSLKDMSNVRAFRRKHWNNFKKRGRIYARDSSPKNLKSFIENWKNKNKEKINDMGINELKVI